MKPPKSMDFYDVKTQRHTVLAPREVECLIYWLRGKTAHQMASLLALSPHTIEFYKDRLKNKLDCATKSELIERILSGRFIDQGVTTPIEARLVEVHQKMNTLIHPLNAENTESMQ